MKKVLLKSDLVANINLATGFEIAKIDRVVDCFLEGIQKSVCNKQTVKLLKFGVFEPRLHSGGKARNPKTGQEVIVEPFPRPWFRFATAFKKRVKEEVKL